MEQQQQNLFELQLDSFTNQYLSESAKWAKFLAIVGFVLCVLLALAGIFAGALMGYFTTYRAGDAFATETQAVGAAASIAVTIFTLIGVVIYFFPCLFLYRFATRMQAALRSNDQQQLIGSLASLKSWFKYIGILTIVMLAIYALMFIVQALAFSALS